MTNYNPARIPAAVNGVLAAQFEFVEWTRGGQLRAPAFKGFRFDKPAEEVIREDG